MLLNKKRKFELISSFLREKGFTDNFIENIKQKYLNSKELIQNIIIEEIQSILENRTFKISSEIATKPSILILCGINGSGKTTTAFKMKQLYEKNDIKTKIISCDCVKIGAKHQFKKLRKNKIEQTEDKLSTIINRIEKIEKFLQTQFNNAIKNNLDKIIIDTPGIVIGNTFVLNYIKSIIDIIKNISNQKEIPTILISDANAGNALKLQLIFAKKALNIKGIFVSKFDITNDIGYIISILKELNLFLFGIGNGIKTRDILQSSSSDLANIVINLKDFTYM